MNGQSEIEGASFVIKYRDNTAYILFCITNSLDKGAVEICFNGVWGAVCDNNWGRHEAEVTCRQLGFSTESKEMS